MMTASSCTSRQHRVEVGEGAHAGVLVQHVEHVAGGVAHRDDLHARMRIDHGEMGQAPSFPARLLRLITFYPFHFNTDSRSRFGRMMFPYHGHRPACPCRSSSRFGGRWVAWLKISNASSAVNCGRCIKAPTSSKVAVHVEQLVLVDRDGRYAEHRHLARHGAAGADEQVAVGRNVGNVQRRGDHPHALRTSGPGSAHPAPCHAAASTTSTCAFMPSNECVHEIAAALVILRCPRLRSHVHDLARSCALVHRTSRWAAVGRVPTGRDLP